MRIDIQQLEFIDLKLRTILVMIEKELGFEFTITSLYRINDGGVHGTLPLRGADLRCKDDRLGYYIASWINDRWVYDSSRLDMECAIYHDAGSGGHLHLQVHPDTKYMG